MQAEDGRADATCNRRFLAAGLHVFVLFGFALAQPLYDLLARNPQFFVTQRSQPADIWLLVLSLSFLLPGIVVLALWGLGLISRHVQAVLFGLVVVSLTGVTVLPAVKELGGVPGVAQAAVAGLVGVALALAYFRYRAIRLFLTALSPAVLLFPGLFLFNSAAYKLAFPQQGLAGAIFGSRSNTPVVLVVFDEFSMMSLLDENREIDAQRYPNFAALGRDSTWFRDATTVSEDTHMALASILTGRYPDRKLLSTVQDYPNNLFTLLGGSHEVRGFESVTSLCPASVCRDVTPLPAVGPRLRVLSMDLSAIYLHRILPTELSNGLPVVTQSWRDFWQQKGVDAAGSKDDNSSADRVRLFERFLASMTETHRPGFYFLHILLPHVPWEYLPSGKKYTEAGWEVPGLDFNEERWGSDEWLVTQAHQRYLLQVGFVDTLLGELLAQLKATGLYGRALLIVTADHGLSFHAGGWRRKTRGNEYEIMPIPLFVKAPQQGAGKVSDRNVETIDILPTVADVLGIDLPWPVDGASALDDSLPERDGKTINDWFGNVDLHVDSALPAKWTPLDAKLALFGSGKDPGGLYRIGPHKELVGRRVKDIGVWGKVNLRVELDRPAVLLHNYGAKSGFLPVQITGHLFPERGQASPAELVIAVDGSVWATTRAYQTGPRTERFAALIPETALQGGQPHNVQVYVLTRASADLVRLSSVEKVSSADSSLVLVGEHRVKSISNANGTLIPVRPQSVKGVVSIMDEGNGSVRFEGWAADLRNLQPVETALVFSKGSLVYSGKPTITRRDVVRVFHEEKLLETGFSFDLPAGLFRGVRESDVRLFGVSRNGIASELEYLRVNPGQSPDPVIREVATWVGGRMENFAVETDETLLGYFDGLSTYRLQLHGGDSPQMISVNGWAAFQGKDKAAETIIISVNGDIAAATSICCDRPDVAKHFSDPTYLRSGWNASFSSQELREGENVVTAYVVLDVKTKKLVRLEGSRNSIEVISR